MTIRDGKKQRAFIEGLVKKADGPSYKALSDALGKNPTYVQQFVTKGTPRALRSEHMEKIEALAGGNSDSYSSDVVMVPVQSFKGGMGGGGIIIDEKPRQHFPVQADYLRHVRLDNADLIMIECEGDSMSPTLESGDFIMINRNDRNPARGGVFAIFDSDALVVKRIEKIPSTDPVRLRLISDNAHHSAYDVLADETNITGRVVWYARRI